MNPYAGWRVALRVARREAWRRKGQTALMLVLIALPVLAVSTAAVVWKTSDVSSAESVTRQMGAADALVTWQGGGRTVQCFDPRDCSVTLGGGSSRPPSTAQVRSLVGGRPVLPVAHDMLSYPTAHGLGDLMLLETDLADPMASGLVRLEEGRLPRAAGEIVINQAAVDRGPRLGQTLELTRKLAHGTRTYRLKVVGIAENASSRVTPYAATLPGSIPPPPQGQELSWLVGGGPVTWSRVEQLNRSGLIVASRAVLTDPPPDSELPAAVRVYQDQSGIESSTVTILVLIASMVLLEVVLLAGPAFAVRAKAQAHTLALVAATGGTPAQARRTVLASGVVVGTVGGVLGAALGVLVSFAAVPIAQQHSTEWFGPFEVPWDLVAVVAGFGLLSALLAAVVPAYSASRQNVVAVLAGRRGEGRPSRRSPLIGLVLIGLGLAGAVVGSRPSFGSAPGLVGGGAITSVIGMIFFVPVAVSIVARLSARFPLPLRFAARDAARHRTRTVPAVAAVGATVAGVVALGIALSSQGARDARDYLPSLASGYGAVVFDEDNAGAPDGDAAVAVVHKQLPDAGVSPVVGVPPARVDVQFHHDGQVDGYGWSGHVGTLDVVADSVPAYLGVEATARADAVLRAGGVVLLTGTYNSPLRGDTVMGVVRSNTGRLRVLARVRLPATSLAVPHSAAPVAAVVSPAAAARLKVPTATTALVIRPPISGSQQQDVTEALAASAPASGLYVERGFQPDSATRIIQWVLAILGGILMLGGTLTATFLALSDARPDLATMAAVGARPRTRRAVAAAYALVVGAVGAVLGAPIGFIPGIAISGPLTRDYRTGATSLDIPWLLIIAIVLGLPVITAAVIGACARSRLPLVARID